MSRRPVKKGATASGLATSKIDLFGGEFKSSSHFCCVDPWVAARTWASQS